MTTTEIAKNAGVSQATVSRVLNGGRSVAPSTVARVKKAARDLGDPSANLMLGHIYDRTERHPFHKQIFKSKLGALKAYTAASKQKEPKAFWALSAAYFEGRIVERNLNQTRFYSSCFYLMFYQIHFRIKM